LTLAADITLFAFLALVGVAAAVATEITVIWAILFAGCPVITIVAHTLGFFGRKIGGTTAAARTNCTAKT
jgi:hypothetical protein